MQIVAISPSRRSSQVWLKFNDQSFIPLRVDDLVVLKIKKLIDLSEDQYQNILSHSVGFLLSEYCLRQIAISPKVESILRRKLRLYCPKIIKKYNYPTDIVTTEQEQVIHKIKESNLLDEQKYIDYVIRKYPKKSISEINYLLASLGIDQKINVSPESEINKIKELIAKKYKIADLADYNTKNKIISRLYRKGFALEFIKTAIDESLKVR